MKIIPSILISGALLVGLSVCELTYVDKTFNTFHKGLTGIYQKTESCEATNSAPDIKMLGIIFMCSP